MSRPKFDIRNLIKARRELTNTQLRAIREEYRRISKIAQTVLPGIAAAQSSNSTLGQLTLKNLKAKLGSQLDNATRTIEKGLQTSIFDMATAVTLTHGDLAKAVGIVKQGQQLGMKPAFNKVPQAVLDAINHGQVYNGKPWTLSSAIWGQNAQQHAAMDAIIGQGLADSKPTVQIAEELQQFVNPDKRKKPTTTRPGIPSRIEYNAMRLARTMISQAYRMANTACIMPNPFCEAEQWVTANWHNVCPICIELAESDGYGLGEGVFPKGEAPLDHPNGGCILMPVIPYTMDEISDRLVDWLFETNEDGLGITDAEIEDYWTAVWG